MEIVKGQPKEWKEILGDPWRNLESLVPGVSEKIPFQEVKVWYEERSGKLPVFKEEISSLEDGVAWKAELDETGKVLRIARPDNSFYTVEGRKFSKYKADGSLMFEWNQPVLVSREISTDVNLFRENVNIPVNGFLGVIRDTEGRVLTVVDQEATAETPNHAIVRLAIQASAGKIALMRSGKPEADKQLFELLKIYPGGDVEDLLKTAQYILPIAPEDTNRDLKHNLVLVMPPVDPDSDLHKQLEADGMRKWLSREQLALINVARLTNTHTMAAIRVSEDAELLNDL